MKVYNVKVDAKMIFHFPVVARDSVEAERIVHELCGVNGGETDDELSLFLGILTDFAVERLSKYGEVSCSNLDLRADIYPERDFMNEEINKIGLFRMHPVEQSRMEEPEKVTALLETMGTNGILMEIPETSCCILFDERCMLHLGKEKYLLGAFYVVGRNGNHFCEATQEDICKVKIVMTNRKVVLNADGEDIPVFKLS